MRLKIRDGIAALVFSFGLAAPVAAGPVEDGLAAAMRGDNATALQLLAPLAEGGDVGIGYIVAILYEAGGEGVPPDYVQAYKWFYLAETPNGLRRVAALMTPTQIAEAQSLVRKWKLKH